MKSDPRNVPGWVEAAKHGSHAAFGKLYGHFVAMVHGILLARFRPAIAEELTQECFLIALRKLGQLRDPQRFGPWLAAIARRLDSGKHGEAEVFTTIEATLEYTASIVESSVDAEIVLRAIRALPDAYRETLLLRLVEGLSGPEIAAATGLDPNSVRVNLHRGMKKLRDALGLDTADSSPGSPQREAS